METKTTPLLRRLREEKEGLETCPPEQVHKRMKALLSGYNAKKEKTLADIVDLHQQFELIHPFLDDNGRVGRLIMFKECLAYGIVPFIITGAPKWFYYRGIYEKGYINGFLIDTCLTAQDNYKTLLDYFKIKY
ncbi:MAG: Fic family protein [Bacteroidales bacterium]|nr:Fic family protein [Bacteroidales bacterium]